MLMRAAIWTKYGPPEVIELGNIEKPTPGEKDILVKVHAAAMFPGDAEMRRFDIPVIWLWLPLRLWFGLFRPKRVKVLGQEIAGVVEAVGDEVENFKPGDRVLGLTGINFGGHAEYICLTEDFTSFKGVVAKMPNNMSFEEACAVPVAGINAWHFLNRAEIKKGEKVLINGAGGSIGCFAIQIAKHFGAEVTAVDSGEKLETLRSIGADYVIDYKEEDFTHNGKTYDVIFDVIDKSPYARSMKSLNSHGRLLLVNTRIFHMLRALWTSWTSNKKSICELAGPNKQYFDSLNELIESNKIKTVIDRCYPLEQIVEAHRYLDTRLKTGDVIINIHQQHAAEIDTV